MAHEYRWWELHSFRHLAAICLLVCLLILLNTPLAATEYYVDYAVGDDAQSGTSASTAWKHIPGSPGSSGKSGSTTIGSGDTIYLKRGVVYGDDVASVPSGTIRLSQGNVRVDSGGDELVFGSGGLLGAGVTQGDSVIVAGEGLFSVNSVVSDTRLSLDRSLRHLGMTNLNVIVGSFVEIATTSWGTGPVVIRGLVDLSRTDGVMIRGSAWGDIEITDTGSYGVYVNNTSPRQGIVLQNLWVHHTSTKNSAGVYLRNVEYALIDSCEISNIGNDDGVTGDDGIYAVTHASYLTVNECRIHHVGDDGIQLAPADDGYVQFSTIHDVGLTSGDVHPDGVATNASEIFRFVFRYNSVFNTRNPTDLEAIDFEIYGNIFYDITDGSPGNHGIRLKRGATGKVYNNTIAWNNVGVYVYSDAGAVEVVNNIFYNNADQYDVPEIVLPSNPSTKTDYNLYVRRDLRPRDKIISYGGKTYTLAEYRALRLGPQADNAANSLACTASDCTIGSAVFASSKRTAPDFRPSSMSSPQVDAGTDLGFSLDWYGEVRDNSGTGWDIGAIEAGSSDGHDQNRDLTAPTGIRVQ